jgi:poly(3-hydroxybutyrate) depolymerase
MILSKIVGRAPRGRGVPRITDPVTVPASGERGAPAADAAVEGGDNSVNVEHLRIIGGTHAWPRIVGEVGNDVDASEEIWKLLSRYDINGVVPVASAAGAASRPR